MTNAEHHLEILGTAWAREDHHFILTTDGSGLDGSYIGIGSAWVLQPRSLTRADWKEEYRGACGATRGSVQRAEMMALVDGLRYILVLMGLPTLKDISVGINKPLRDISEFDPTRRIKVWWVGDRENLILQVARDRQGMPRFQRRTEPDLWKQFEWLEHVFDITAVYVPRNTSPEQIVVDEVAGKVRKYFVKMHSESEPE